MRYSVRLLPLILFAAFFLSASNPIVHAQTQASCTFTHFDLNPANPGDPIATPYSVNDFGTIVGRANFASGAVKGFVRYSNGSVTYFRAWDFPPALTALVARNDKGASVGDVNGSTGFLLQGSVLTPIVLGPTFNYPIPRGINKWNSIVGYYGDPRGNIHGFKRWSNGGFLTLDFPGMAVEHAFGTQPAAIDDAGTVVGTYNLQASATGHGFIYNHNQWATLDFPNTTTGTFLTGISNSGVIVGNVQTSTQGSSCLSHPEGVCQRPFLYKNGKFETISDPAAPPDSNTTVNGISPNSHMISGYSESLSATQAFTASCQ